MNRRLIIFGIIVFIVVAVIFNKTSDLKNKVLPNGGIGQEQLSSDKISVSPDAIQGRPQVEIATSKGTILVELRPDLAPKTVANFLAKWNSGDCNGKTFHRVEDWVIQGCDPQGDGTGGETTLVTETSSEPFTAGSLGVARKMFPKELSNNSQFFITKKDSSFLNREYTYFGKVITGMEVVKNINIGDKILSISLLTK